MMIDLACVFGIRIIRENYPGSARIVGEFGIAITNIRKIGAHQYLSGGEYPNDDIFRMPNAPIVGLVPLCPAGAGEFHYVPL